MWPRCIALPRVAALRGGAIRRQTPQAAGPRGLCSRRWLADTEPRRSPQRFDRRARAPGKPPAVRKLAPGCQNQFPAGSAHALESFHSAGPTTPVVGDSAVVIANQTKVAHIFLLRRCFAMRTSTRQGNIPARRTILCAAIMVLQAREQEPARAPPELFVSRNSPWGPAAH